MHLATACYNLVAHALDYPWQLVRADMWVGVAQYAGGGTKLAEDVEYLVNIASFLASCV